VTEEGEGQEVGRGGRWQGGKGRESHPHGHFSKSAPVVRPTSAVAMGGHVA